MFDPPFKLCIHTRDFNPDSHITDNVQNAIKNSNSAIIVMSQAFVNSGWCQYEFKSCFIENMKDPTFKLCIIMMQRVYDLINTTEVMKDYFRTKTCLESGDPLLFLRVSS